MKKKKRSGKENLEHEKTIIYKKKLHMFKCNTIVTQMIIYIKNIRKIGGTKYLKTRK